MWKDTKTLTLLITLVAGLMIGIALPDGPERDCDKILKTAMGALDKATKIAEDADKALREAEKLLRKTQELQDSRTLNPGNITNTAKMIVLEKEKRWMYLLT